MTPITFPEYFNGATTSDKIAHVEDALGYSIPTDDAFDCTLDRIDRDGMSTEAAVRLAVVEHALVTAMNRLHLSDDDDDAYLCTRETIEALEPFQRTPLPDFDELVANAAVVASELLREDPRPAMPVPPTARITPNA